MKRIQNLIHIISLAAISLLIMGVTCWAAQPEALGTYKDWSAYTYKEHGNRVCFMISRPKKSEGTYKKRGDVYVQVTHRPAEKSWDVVSFMSGYAFKPGSPAQVMVDKKKFKLFTDGGSAWTPDASSDRNLVNAMRNAKTLSIEGTSNKNTKTKDHYSLDGISAAYKSINTACGAKR